MGYRSLCVTVNHVFVNLLHNVPQHMLTLRFSFHSALLLLPTHECLLQELLFVEFILLFELGEGCEHCLVRSEVALGDTGLDVPALKHFVHVCQDAVALVEDSIGETGDFEMSVAC